jgi:hypothetical protein
MISVAGVEIAFLVGAEEYGERRAVILPEQLIKTRFLSRTRLRSLGQSAN